MIPRKDVAFVQPIWCTENVLPEDLSAWLDEENTLDECNHLFFLSEMASSDDTINYKKLKSLEDFSIKSSLDKTSTKKKRTKVEIPLCVLSLSDSSRKKIIETHKLEKGKFSYKVMDFMTKIESYLMILDKEL